VSETAKRQDDKRGQVETLLTDVFKLLELPARLDFKDLADGSLGVALHFDAGASDLAPGKKHPLVDSVQFWVNKVVNRPNTPRRWVNLGVGDFPAPRNAAPSPAAAPSAPPAQRSPVTPPKGQAKTEAARTPKSDAPQEPRRGREVDERSLTPAANAELSALGTLLAKKAATHGRLYGVMLLPPDSRALLLKAADAVPGQRAKAEGEGHWRRVVFMPDKPVPMPKKQVMPDYDDDEDE
jgi:predicted RNA-binding protein Jag